MRIVTLNTSRAGMTRQREKGGASPDTLYELTNGFVNASKAPQQRPGTTWMFAWPENTKGVCAFKGVFHAFSAEPIDTGEDDYVVDCLRHPDAAFAGQIAKIHGAQPFLGFLYVVAEFDDGQVFHYWLQEPQPWLASHAYNGGERVQPTVPTGYYYQATTELTPPAWAPAVKRAIGDVVQPTKATGWKYEVSAVTGANPISQGVEPIWPETEGATVTEYVQANPTPPPPGAPPETPVDPTGGRYDNIPTLPGGTGFGGNGDGGNTYLP